MIDNLKILYDSHMINPARIRENPSFLDGGACIGESSDEFLKLFPNARLILIEPNKSHVSTLKTKFPKATIFNAALYKKSNETLNFTEFKDLPKWGNVKGLYRDSGHPKMAGGMVEYSVNTISLNDILLFNGLADNIIDYMKLDIEGCELDIIMTLSKTLAKSIKQLSCEVHRPEWVLPISRRLISLGFDTAICDNEVYAQTHE